MHRNVFVMFLHQHAREQHVPHSAQVFRSPNPFLSMYVIVPCASFALVLCFRCSSLATGAPESQGNPLFPKTVKIAHCPYSEFPRLSIFYVHRTVCDLVRQPCHMLFQCCSFQIVFGMPFLFSCYFSHGLSIAIALVCHFTCC